VDETQSIVLADGAVPIDVYATVALVPGSAIVPAGLFTFTGWFYVSSTSGTTTTAKYELLTVTEAGVQTSHGDRKSVV
jgi:hypothetical protein